MPPQGLYNVLSGGYHLYFVCLGLGWFGFSVPGNRTEDLVHVGQEAYGLEKPAGFIHQAVPLWPAYMVGIQQISVSVIDLNTLFLLRPGSLANDSTSGEWLGW